MNPWKKISSREIYKNAWIRLREDQVITPGGKPGIYGVVEAKPAIGIIPLDEQLNTWLVGQYRYTLDCYSWEIPEGGAHDGENRLQAAQRELSEETGLTAANWTELGEMYTSNSFTNERAYLFLARELEQDTPRPEDTEQLSVIKLPFDEAWQKVLNYEIKDSMAVIGLLRTRQWLLAKGLIK